MQRPPDIRSDDPAVLPAAGTEERVENQEIRKRAAAESGNHAGNVDFEKDDPAD
jgi:hypothetical protein